MYATTPEREQLVADIKHAGFYPDLVLEVVDDALAGMNPDAHFVQHETHFSRDDFHRHITVMVLCGEHVIFAHLDDQHLEGDAQGTVAHVSVEVGAPERPERGHHQLRFQPAAGVQRR